MGSGGRVSDMARRYYGPSILWPVDTMARQPPTAHPAIDLYDLGAKYFYSKTSADHSFRVRKTALDVDFGGENKNLQTMRMHTGIPARGLTIAFVALHAAVALDPDSNANLESLI